MRINIWIPDEVLKEIDLKRGKVSRSEFLVKNALGKLDLSSTKKEPLESPVIIKKGPVEKKHFSSMLNEWV